MVMRQRIAYAKIFAGIGRLILAHPDIEWFVSLTPETFEAEQRVQAAVNEYVDGGSLARVRATFIRWVELQIKADKEKKADATDSNVLQQLSFPQQA